MVLERNFPAETVVCGMSSWLVQVTVSPTFTFSSAGEKVKLSMVTLISSAWARTPRGSSRAAARMRLRKTVLIMCDIPLAGQRRVDDGELVLALLEVDAGDAEHAAKLGVLDLHRSGRAGGAGLRLRECGRAGGVE